MYFHSVNLSKIPFHVHLSDKALDMLKLTRILYTVMPHLSALWCPSKLTGSLNRADI